MRGRAVQVVLKAGEVLFLPRSHAQHCAACPLTRTSWWFHYIISLDISVQCNLRSGLSGRHRDAIENCGFRQYKD